MVVSWWEGMVVSWWEGMVVSWWEGKLVLYLVGGAAPSVCSPYGVLDGAPPGIGACTEGRPGPPRTGAFYSWCLARRLCVLAMAFCKGAVAWDDLAERESPVHRKPCLSLFVVLAWCFVAVAWCLLAALSPLSARYGLLQGGCRLG